MGRRQPDFGAQLRKITALAGVALLLGAVAPSLATAAESPVPPFEPDRTPVQQTEDPGDIPFLVDPELMGMSVEQQRENIASAMDDAGAPDGLPSLDRYFGFGVVAIKQKAVAANSKQRITTGEGVRQAWGLLGFTNIELPLPVVPNPMYQPACATEDAETQIRGGYLQVELFPFLPEDGRATQLGTLTEQTIHVVAFGAIPATATLSVELPKGSDGLVEPLKAHVWQTQLKSSCDPTFAPPTVGAPSLVTGDVNLRLSDLVVDGAPVDLGEQCRTSEPAELRMGPVGFYYPGSGGELGAYEGLYPAARFPFSEQYFGNQSEKWYGSVSGTRLPASSGLDIPKFSGCGSEGEDLSAIISAMAAGPNNPLTGYQGFLIAHDDMPWNNVLSCNIQGQCQRPIPEPADPPVPSVN